MLFHCLKRKEKVKVKIVRKRMMALKRNQKKIKIPNKR